MIALALGALAAKDGADRAERAENVKAAREAEEKKMLAEEKKMLAQQASDDKRASLKLEEKRIDTDARLRELELKREADTRESQFRVEDRISKREDATQREKMAQNFMMHSSQMAREERQFQASLAANKRSENLQLAGSVISAVSQVFGRDKS